MDDKWRVFTCPTCRGYGMTWVGDASWDGTAECDCTDGRIFIRPKGHSFEWPGGKATGMWTEEYYDKATPYPDPCSHGVRLVNDNVCKDCDREFFEDFGVTWEEEERAARNLERRERYARNKKKALAQNNA